MFMFWLQRTLISCPTAPAASSLLFFFFPRDAHFVSHVDLGEGEGAEVGVGLLHRRLDHLAEQLFHKLADVGPHLFHCLRGYRRREIKEFWKNIKHISYITTLKDIYVHFL